MRFLPVDLLLDSLGRGLVCMLYLLSFALVDIPSVSDDVVMDQLLLVIHRSRSLLLSSVSLMIHDFRRSCFV